MPPRRTPSDPDQQKRFIETARQLECDQDKERFEEKLKRIAGAKVGASSKSKAPRHER